MPTRPQYSSLALQAASDALYAVIGDAYDSSALRVAPTLGQIKQGARPGRERSGQRQNWLDREVAATLSELISHVLDVEDVQLVNEVAARAAADAAMELKYKLIPALTWDKVGTVGAINAFGYGGNERTSLGTSLASNGIWYAVGAAGVAAYSRDFGRTWTALTGLVGGPTLVDVAVSPANGYVAVAATSSQNVVHYATSSLGVWAASGTVFGGSMTSGAVRYDDVAGLFCLTAIVAGAPVVATSPTGATWTVRTTPASFPSGVQATSLAFYRAANRLVWVVQDSTTTSGSRSMHVATSTDGGVTWSYVGATTMLYSGASGAFLQRLSVDQSTGRLFATSQGSGIIVNSQIRYSDDSGATWTTKTLNQTTQKPINVASMQGVAVAGVGTQLIYSADGGDNWRQLGNLDQIAGATDVVVGEGGNGFFALTNTTLYATPRYGLQGGIVST